MSPPTPHEIHLWAFTLGAPAHSDAAVLDDAERARAARFRRPADRDRFVASHAALRRALGAYLDVPPREVAFAAGPQGKPALRRPPNALDLRFNLSHSGHEARVAVAVGREVGVDVEAWRPLPDLLRLAERVAAPHEVAALRSLELPEREAAFFQLWVAKEAVLKARGCGLHADPRRVHVKGLGTDAVHLEDAGAPGAWHLTWIDAPEGYSAALSVEGESARMVYRTPGASSP